MIGVTQATRTLTADVLITIFAGLHELPHKQVVRLIAKIEQQIKDQHEKEHVKGDE